MEIEYKEALVDIGLTSLVIAEDRLFYFEKNHRFNLEQYSSEINMMRNEIEAIKEQIGYYDNEMYHDAQKLLNAWHQKHKRLRSRIDMMLDCSNNVYFATFTLNNDYIKLKKDTLEKYLKRVLKEYCGIYVANADYGKGNGRLHFHAVLTCNNVDALNDAWIYGFNKLQKVKVLKDSSIKMAKYITKLTNHALKDSTKPLENKLIYSRNIQDACIKELFN